MLLIITLKKIILLIVYQVLDFDDKAEINNPLIGKKFYYLYKGEDDGELFLAVDDDMPTIVFINDTLMDNWNTMEGNKWIIEKIEKKVLC